MGNGIDRGNRATNEHLSNYELAMRLQVPSIKMDNFFTDLNGFQVFKYCIEKNQYNPKSIDDKTKATEQVATTGTFLPNARLSIHRGFAY
jgi:hypothetical protein